MVVVVAVVVAAVVMPSCRPPRRHCRGFVAEGGPMLTHVSRRSPISSGQNETSYSAPTSLGRPIANLGAKRCWSARSPLACKPRVEFGASAHMDSEDNPRLQTCWECACVRLQRKESNPPPSASVAELGVHPTKGTRTGPAITGALTSGALLQKPPKRRSPGCVGQSPEESNSLRHRIENFGPPQLTEKAGGGHGAEALGWAPHRRLGSLTEGWRIQPETSDMSLKSPLKCAEASNYQSKVSTEPRKTQVQQSDGGRIGQVPDSRLSGFCFSHASKNCKTRDRHRLLGRLGRKCQTS